MNSRSPCRDILKLTALFTARNGRAFVQRLMQKEAQNDQFDVLQPNHSLFSYFTKLVDQYTKLLIPQDLPQKLETSVKDKFSTLRDVQERVEYQRYQDEALRIAKEEQDKERSMILFMFFGLKGSSCQSQHKSH